MLRASQSLECWMRDLRNVLRERTETTMWNKNPFNPSDNTGQPGHLNDTGQTPQESQSSEKPGTKHGLRMVQAAETNAAKRLCAKASQAAQACPACSVAV